MPEKYERAATFGLPDDGAWRRSYMRIPSTVGEINGFPIKAYGRTFIYGVSPDFQTNVVLQHGAKTPQVKIIPQKSWEVRSNYCGSMVSYQPRISQNDFQAFLSVNLIDGDPQTAWSSRGEAQTDVDPAWVRIDLAAEEMLTEIVLTPRKDGYPWPKELVIKLSCDAWHWTAVFDTKGEAPPAGEQVCIKLNEPTRAKQIWIIGNQLPKDSLLRGDHTFSLAEVEVINQTGENVALLTRGAGVTVSSTNYGFGSVWDHFDLFWPTQYDLGAKWMRLSFGNGPFDYDTLQWRFVEQEKGKYLTDPKTLQALAEATANGYQIMVMLGIYNWLYTSTPEKGLLTHQTFPTEGTPWQLTTREEFEGYKNYVRHMVKAFKGAVAYWEIGNEPVLDSEERVQTYCNLVKEVAPIIRETDPDAKIGLAGAVYVPGIDNEGVQNSYPYRWLYRCIDQGVAPLVDAIGWHIQIHIHPGGLLLPSGIPYWDTYPDRVKEFKQYAEANGFKGVYTASEYWLGDPYPPNASQGYPPHVEEHVGELVITEIRKAKDLLRTYVLNAGLGVITIYCDIWRDVLLDGDNLFRDTFASDPLSPKQPKASYYSLRTLCTALDGAEPTELSVGFSNQEQKFENWNFQLENGGLLVGLELPGASVDKHPGVTTDVIIYTGKCSKVIGIDTLNGFEQELKFEQHGGKVVVPSVVVRDYPLMLRLEK